MALNAYQNGNYSLCLHLLNLQNQQQQLSVQHRQLQLMAQIGHLLKPHSTTTIALATAWANLLGISLLSSTPTPSPSFIHSQHRKLAALLHPDKNHYKDASLRFTQLQQGVETVAEYLSSSTTATDGGSSDASKSSYQNCYDTNDDDGQNLDDSWVNTSDGGNFPWWSRWDDDDSEEEEQEEEEGGKGEEEQQEEEDVSYLKSLTHEELKQEVAKRREGILFENSKTMHSRLARGRAVLTDALHEQAAKEFEQQLYGGFFPAF
jgi:hypothetical protein